jgi:hypothetical protein
MEPPGSRFLGSLFVLSPETQMTSGTLSSGGSCVQSLSFFSLMFCLCLLGCLCVTCCMGTWALTRLNGRRVGSLAWGAIYFGFVPRYRMSTHAGEKTTWRKLSSAEQGLPSHRGTSYRGRNLTCLAADSVRHQNELLGGARPAPKASASDGCTRSFATADSLVIANADARFAASRACQAGYSGGQHARHA